MSGRLPCSGMPGFEGQTQFFCDAYQALVFRPELRALYCRDGGQQMYIYEAHAAAHEPVLFDEPQGLRVTHFQKSGHFLPEVHQLRPVFQTSTAEFADDHEVHRNPVLPEEGGQPWTAPAEMINPDRSVGQNHRRDREPRRRGMGFNPGSEPPSPASCRALSR